jgi:hypothetical protein
MLRGKHMIVARGERDRSTRVVRTGETIPTARAADQAWLARNALTRTTFKGRRTTG